MLSIYTGALVEQSCSRISFFHHVVPRLKITELRERLNACGYIKSSQANRFFAVETYLLNEFGRIFCLWQRKFELRRLDSQSLNWLGDKYCINSPNAKCLLQ